MERQILIKTARAWFEFSKSRTGQIDFVGKVSEMLKEDELLEGGYQKIASSAYFTPSYYIYLQNGENANPLVYVADDVDVSDSDTFDFLVHIGSLFAAVDSKDSFLAGELYLRRRSVFEKFPQLTSFIMEDLCAEILFSLCYRKMQNVEPDSIPLLFNSAKKKLDFDSSRESLAQVFMRYFKDNAVTLTLPLVGTCYYDWEDEMCPYVLEKLCDNLSAENLLGAAEKIREAKPKRMSYGGKLCSLSERTICVQVTV